MQIAEAFNLILSNTLSFEMLYGAQLKKVHYCLMFIFKTKAAVRILSSANYIQYICQHRTLI